MPLRNLSVLALVATLALSACSSDDPEPKVAPEPTAPTSPATASTSAAPELADPTDVVRQWVQARNRALQDGDVSAVRALSSSNCETCEDLIRPIEEVHADGGRFDTPGWQVAGADVESQTDVRAEVNVGLVYAPGSTVPSTGAEPIRYDEEKHIAVFRLKHSGDGWVVRFISYLS